MLDELRPAVVAALFLAILSGCGDATGPAAIQVDTLNSTATLDGYVNSAGSAHADSGGPVTGDLEATIPGVGFREFWSFALDSIPAGATILQADLHLYQACSAGSPFTKLGSLVLSHLDFGDTLDSADYARPALGIQPFVADTSTADAYRMDVTASVASDLSSPARRIQFRSEFSNAAWSGDNVTDAVSLTDAEDSNCVGPTPKLVVRWRQ